MDMHLIPLDYFELIVAAWLIIKAVFDGRQFLHLGGEVEKLKEDLETERKRNNMKELEIEKLQEIVNRKI